MIRIGTSGWQIPRASAEAFPPGGTTLQRFSAVFNAVEINTSFYRPHRPQTWARWAESTPEGFAFAVKGPKSISHERRLVDCAEPLDAFLAEIAHLGGKLGVVLWQFAPSLKFDPAVAGDFFALFRGRHDGPAACEPRHPTWFTPEADALLAAHRIARVAADPVRPQTSAEPGGWDGLIYHRLHGSPQVYATPYGEGRLAPLAASLRAAAAPVWVFFDNTLSGAAAADGLILRRLIS